MVSQLWPKSPRILWTGPNEYCGTESIYRDAEQGLGCLWGYNFKVFLIQIFKPIKVEFEVLLFNFLLVCN